MKKIILALTIMSFTALGFSQEKKDHCVSKSEKQAIVDMENNRSMDAVMDMEKAMESKNIIVVAYHADWCHACEKLAPKLQQAKKEVISEQVQMVKFDFTSKKTIEHTKELAVSLGLLAYLPDQPRTGYALVFDAETKEQIGMITSIQSSDEIIAYISNLL